MPRCRSSSSRALADWRCFADGYAAVELAVNLPIAFLKDAAARSGLRRRLPKHPAFHGMIVEVDSRELVRDLAVARDIARELRAVHVGIAIDDAGAEWPQLLDMVDCPFAEIKVDRAFITGCADDRAKQHMCRQIVDLGRGYGMRTVAEGVETRAEFLAVRGTGFDAAQGFLFAKPMGAQRFARTTPRGPIMRPH